MLRLLKKQTNIRIYSPVNGQVYPISDAQDDVFRSGLMGAGFFVVPENELIYSPVNGVVKSVFPTNHALVIATKDNTDILIHIGTDTVELGGKPFEIKVSEGNQVTPRTELVTVDFDMIRQADKGDEVYILFPELDKDRQFKLNPMAKIQQGEVVGEIK